MNTMYLSTSRRWGASSGAGASASLPARALRACLAFAAALTLTAVVVPVASAATGYAPSGSFATAGEVSDPQHVAVQNSTGNVFVVDRGNNRVQVFTPDGAGSATYLTEFGSGIVDGPLGIAIDQSTGDVYVSDADNVVKFTSDGAPVPTLTQDGIFVSPGVTGPIAFDQTAHQLLVADAAANTVRRYSTTGLPGTSFDGSTSGAAFSQLKDIAVQDDGDVLVVDARRVLRFKDDDGFAAKLPFTGYPSAVTAVPGTDRVLVGENGGYTPDFSVSFPSGRLYRYGGDTLEGMTALPSNDQAIAGLAVAGDSSGRLYAVTAPGNFSGGDTGVQALAPFEIQAPSLSASAIPDETTAKLTGSVNPQNDTSTWWFEYGLTTAYGTQKPATPGSIPAGTDPVAVSADIASLTAGTTYHFRLVARNAGGTTNGPDHTFATDTNNPAGQPTANGRQFEMVSPLEKNGAGVNSGYFAQGGDLYNGVPDSLGGTATLAPDGNSAQFTSSGVFGESEAAANYNHYVSRRSSSDWTTGSLEPPQMKTSSVERTNFSFVVSKDLSKTLVWSNRALAPGGVDDHNNLYVRDNDTKTYELVATGPPTGLNAPLDALEDWATIGLGINHFGGASDDFSRMIIRSGGKLTPDGGSGEYLWTRGHGLSALPHGATSMSPDGRRLLSAPGAANDMLPIYLTTDGHETQVTASQRTGDDPSVENGGVMLGASGDKTIVYFVSDATLTDASTGGRTIYRYDAASGDLVDLLAAFPSADRGLDDTFTPFNGVVSGDGSRLYFGADGQLAPGAVPGSAHKLYLWHDGTITATPIFSPDSWLNGGFPPLNAMSIGISPNGEYLVLESPRPLTDYPTGRFAQVYTYHAGDSAVRCVSCDPTGRPPTRSSFLKALYGYAGMDSPAPRVGNDGTFGFSGGSPLVRADVNSRTDVYLWHDGHASLITSGKDDADAIFADRTADSKTILFSTTARLVARDTDSLADAYVARVDGGLPAQAVDATKAASCAGTDCQGPPTPAAVVPSLGSVSFSGTGNEDPGSGPPAALTVKSSSAKSIAGTSGVVTVTVPGKGRVTITGSGLLAASKSAAKAGKVKVTVRLSSKARKSLAKRRKYATRVRVRFTASDGRSASSSLKVTFTVKSTKKKGR